MPRREVGGAITVITAADIEARQSRLVSDLLRSVPGVSVNRAGPAGSLTQVRIRGADANHTLVLIDGIEVNDPAFGAEFDFAHLLASDVERIEVLRGNQSALWGSDAIGGVVNIVTRRGRQGFEATGFAEGGSFGTGHVAASARGGGERYDAAVSAAYLRTDGINVSLAGNERDGYDNRTFAFNGGARLLDNLTIRAVLRHTDASKDFDAGDPPRDGDRRTDIEQNFGRLQGKLALFGGDWEHIVGASLAYTDNRTFADGNETNRAFADKLKLDYQTNVYFRTPDLADAKHTLTGLVEREHERFGQRGLASPFGNPNLDRRQTAHGLVGEYRVSLFDALSFGAALRHDDNERFEDFTTYRLSAAYSHAATLTRLHGSYGTGVKNPTFAELFGFFGNFVGNPNLQPEQSRGFDVGVEQTFLAGRLTLDVTYFHHNLTDEIASIRTGGFFVPVNLDGLSRREGVEVSGRWALMPGLDLVASYTYTSTAEPNGQEELRRPRHIASFTANHAFLDGRANVNLGLDYNGTAIDQNFGGGFPFPRVTLGDYVLVRLAGSYAVTPSVDLLARIENLLDEDFQEVFGYRSPGIAGYVGARARF